MKNELSFKITGENNFCLIVDDLKTFKLNGKRFAGCVNSDNKTFYIIDITEKGHCVLHKYMPYSLHNEGTILLGDAHFQMVYLENNIPVHEDFDIFDESKTIF